jgi:dipeptidyl aminopeptidase/acylaminoacyl peptidase
VGEYIDQSSRVKAVVSLAGVMDLSQPFPNAGSNDIETMKRIGFSETNMMEASPISYVTPDDPPFLLIHGDRDDLVPYQQSQVMYDKLVQAGVPAQLVIIKNGAHSLSEAHGPLSPSLMELNLIILQFLNERLK